MPVPDRYFDIMVAMGLVYFASAIWYNMIHAIVPTPYLDEVFHIGQARNYVFGKWSVWDPKITTPPGLYIVSYLQSKISRDPFQSPNPEEFTGSFRTINVFASMYLAWVVHRLLFLNVETHGEEQLGTDEACKPRAELIAATINICLFPPLFFFYGLFYTDVLSALSVLIAYRFFLSKEEYSLLCAGVVSLWFRQTNIFWVAIYLGGLAVCRTLPKGRPEIEFPRQPTFFDIVEGSWKHASVYDPLISQAYFEDYIKTGISLTIAAAAQLKTVYLATICYQTLLLLFGSFVSWNRGVVLGDKENHTVSIHLAQMLYIWPYFMFFSLPLLHSYLLNPLDSRTNTRLVPGFGGTRAILPRPIVAIPTMAVMTMIVHFNTIVHPFTLADNRHYMFYVFRILRWHPSVKYLAVPIYFICAWAAITALGNLPEEYNLHTEQQGERVLRVEKKKGVLPEPCPKPLSGNRASFLLIWLLSTSLSLVTAPLVEPRYFILPWLMWRLHTQSPGPWSHLLQARKQTSISRQEIVRSALSTKNCEQRLQLERFWFLAINILIGYIFLEKGFEWPQEPGKVQRFIW